MNKKEKLIISLYDYTGQWAQPYIDAGYPVILWDAKVEGNIISERFWKEVMCYKDFIYGVLAAPPCDDFAVSGARWWIEKDKDIERISVSMALVEMVLIVKTYAKNLKFWVLENPVGRIERLVPEIKPFRQMLFNPCDFGDAYTKKTILYGEFNTALTRNYVEPIKVCKQGSWLQKLGGKSERTKTLRSATPQGFAKAFFYANQ